MKILILGAGQVGSSAAYHLSREEANEVTVVDRRPDVLRELQDRLDIRTVVGHGQHGGARALRQPSATGRMAGTAAQGRDSVLVLYDRASGCVIRRDQHRNIHRA